MLTVTDRVYRMGSEGAVYMGMLTVTDRVYRMGSEGAVYMGMLTVTDRGTGWAVKELYIWVC